MIDPNDQALGRLPHGKEFRFIDKIITLVPGNSGVAEYILRPELEFLKGHMPGQPMMPGVLLIEACAQLAGVVAQSDPKIPALPDLRLTGVRTAKILGAVLPGQTVVLRTSIAARLGNLIQAETSAHVGDQLIFSADITLSGVG